MDALDQAILNVAQKLSPDAKQRLIDALEAGIFDSPADVIDPPSDEFLEELDRRSAAPPSEWLTLEAAMALARAPSDPRR